MLTPNATAIIMIALTIFLLILIPLLDSSEKFGKYISLRYTLVSIIAITTVGCVLDFSHLATESRNIVLLGGIILVGLFVLVRSLEKIKLGDKKIDLKLHKGDAGADLKLENKDKS